MGTDLGREPKGNIAACKILTLHQTEAILRNLIKLSFFELGLVSQCVFLLQIQKIAGKDVFVPILEVPYKFVQGTQTENNHSLILLWSKVNFIILLFDWLHKCDNHCIG